MKRIITLVLILVLLFSLTACGNSEAKPGNEPNSGAEETNPNTVSNTTSTLEEPAAIQQPVLNWFKIDEFHMGIRKLVMEFTNPNPVAIDFNLNVTFFKDGEKIGVAEELYKLCAPANEKCIIWSNWEIPEADKLDLNFVYCNKSEHTPVKCSYKEVAKTDASVTLNFTPQGDFKECIVDVIGTVNGNVTAHMFYDFYDMNSNEFCFETTNAFDSYTVCLICYN